MTVALKKNLPLDVLSQPLSQQWPLSIYGLQDHLTVGRGMQIFWTDCVEACRHYQKQLEADSQVRKEYFKKRTELSRLHQLPIWIRSPRGLVHSTMYELYENVVMGHGGATRALLKVPSLEVSFISPSGPYKRLALAECLNEATYLDFVMVALLENRLPQRDFRVRIKSRLLCEYGHHFSQSCLLETTQLTQDGMLLKVSGHEWFSGISQSLSLRFMLKTSHLETLKQMHWPEACQLMDTWGTHSFYTHDRSQPQIEISIQDMKPFSRFDYLANGDIYLFVSYEAFRQTSPTAYEQLKNFVQFCRSGVKGLFQQQG